MPQAYHVAGVWCVQVGNTPGVTRGIQEIHLDKHIKLLDSPGEWGRGGGGGLGDRWGAGGLKVGQGGRVGALPGSLTATEAVHTGLHPIPRDAQTSSGQHLCHSTAPMSEQGAPNQQPS